MDYLSTETSKRIINGIGFSMEVAGGMARITASQEVSVEDIFSAGEAAINNRMNFQKATAYFDEMGDLVIKEKKRGHSTKVTKRYNLDRRCSQMVIPLSHLAAYTEVQDYVNLANW